MIKITYSERAHTLALKGHAGLAEKGQDIICATITGHTYTLAAALEKIKAQHGTRKLVTYFDDGMILIRCTPRFFRQRDIELLFDTFCTCFEGMQEAYPEHVSFARK